MKSVGKLILLIVTDERDLWKEKLRDNLPRIKLPKSDCFCEIYIMNSLESNGDVDDERFPVFHVRTSRFK